MRCLPFLSLILLLLSGCLDPSPQADAEAQVGNEPSRQVEFGEGMTIDQGFEGEILFLQRYRPPAGVVSFKAVLTPESEADYAVLTEVKRTNWQRNYTDLWFILPKATAHGAPIQIEAPLLGSPDEDPALVLYAFASGPAHLHVEVRIAGQSGGSAAWQPAYQSDSTFDVDVRTFQADGRNVEGTISARPGEGFALFFEHSLAAGEGSRTIEMGTQPPFAWQVNGRANNCDGAHLLQLIGTPFHPGTSLPYKVSEQRTDRRSQTIHLMTWSSGVEEFLHSMGFETPHMEFNGSDFC